MHDVTFHLPVGGTGRRTWQMNNDDENDEMTKTTTPTTTATTTTTTTTTTTSKKNTMTTTAQYEIVLEPEEMGSQAKSMVLNWPTQTGSMIGARSTNL
jgi:hypothetical protein